MWSFETIMVIFSLEQAIIDNEYAELLAFRQGLRLAVGHQVQKVVLKTDSTGAAAKLNRDEQDRSIHGPLVEQMKSLFQGFGDISVRAVRRAANVLAHVLAKESCDNKVYNVWNGVAPDFVRNQIVMDSDMN
jgi:ribonuclease HI